MRLPPLCFVVCIAQACASSASPTVDVATTPLADISHDLCAPVLVEDAEVLVGREGVITDREDYPRESSEGRACPDLTRSRHPTPCGASLCGNGRRDECLVCSVVIEGGGPQEASQRFARARTLREVCDGDDLGQQTCRSLGYPGGELRCAEGCALDVRGCDVCVSDPAVRACGFVDVDSVGPTSMAIAAMQGKTGVLWLSGEHEGVRGAHFAEFGEDLSTEYESPCFAMPALPSPSSPTPLALTATSAGWIAAVQEPDGDASTVSVHFFDGGHDETHTLLGRAPVLGVSSDGSNALLAWTSPSGPSVVRLDRRGRVVGDVVNVYATHPMRIVPRRGGFALVSGGRGRVGIVRLSMEGEEVGRSVIDGQPGNFTAGPTDEGIRVVMAGGHSMVDANASGRQSGAMVPTGLAERRAPYSMALAVGPRDSYALHVGYTPGLRDSQMTIFRIAPDGSIGQPWPFTMGPGGTGEPAAAVVDGEELVVVWLRRTYPGGIQIARLGVHGVRERTPQL